MSAEGKIKVQAMSLAYDPQAISVLDHDRPGQLRRVTVLGQSRQRGGYLSVPTIDGVQVTVGRGRGYVTQAAHQVLDGRAGGRCEGRPV